MGPEDLARSIRYALERKRAARELEAERRKLRRSEARYRTLVETMAEVTVILDPEGRITFANEEAGELLGLTPSEPEGRSFVGSDWRITAPGGESFPEGMPPFRQVLDTGRPVRTVEIGTERSDGTRRILSLNAAPLEDPDGELYGVVCTMRDITERQRLEEELRHRALAEPYRLGGELVEMDVTMGAVLHGDASDGNAVHVETHDDLIRYADIALFTDKETSGTSFHLFHPDERSVRARALDRERDLRRAIREQEFELHWQPIYELDDGALWGLEPLARWRHPERGLLAPAEFLFLADETGLDPARFWLDLGETVIARQKVKIARLRDAGFGVLADDFGTGYSSLQDFHDRNFDGLKIDTSFVHGLGRGDHGEALVTTMVTMGRAMDLVVMAEGLETRAHRDALVELGCPLGQGYLLGRPVPVDDLHEVFGARSPSSDSPSAAS